MRNRRSPARRTRVDQEVAGPPLVEEDQYVPASRPPLLEIWPWLLLLLLLVIGGLLAAYFVTRDDDNKESSASAVTVPAVVGSAGLSRNWKRGRARSRPEPSSHRIRERARVSIRARS